MKEVTYKDWKKNPKPRMMWVWDYGEGAVKRMVVYVFNNTSNDYPVIAETSEGQYISYKHCAEIESGVRRMTNRELAWWLRGNPTREYKKEIVLM